MVTVRDYRDLEIWKMAMDICEEIYRITDSFPRHEQYGLSSQLRRASVSVPSNIAEGFVRKYPREFRQFISMSLASLAEVYTQITIAVRLEYLDKLSGDTVLSRIEILSKMTTRFYQGIKT